MIARVKNKWLIAVTLLAAGVAFAWSASPKSQPSPQAAIYQSTSSPVSDLPIDKFVFGRLKELDIAPANVCSDEVFVRRVYLDVIGTIPTAQEAKDFLADKNPKKRAELIDKLLADQRFADYWSMKWCDLLRVKAEFPINLWPKAAQAYHHWIWTSLKSNTPYDQFARSLLLASGSSYYDPPANFYRAVSSKDSRTLARAAALTFMGTRAEKWPEEKLLGMAAFFSRVGYKYTDEWKEEIVYLDPVKLASGPMAGRLPDGVAIDISAAGDARELFADWLISPKNPYFARNIVNRIWYWLQGRGIVHPADDIRDDNLPANPELLAYLEGELVAAKYDLKHIYRLILNSKTYQLSSIRNSDDGRAEANFAFYPIRGLDAEVLIDAICQITGVPEKYSSAVPEPFTFIPGDVRSIMISDGNSTSSFLEMFGRPARETGLESERNNTTTAFQRLGMLNSSHIQQKIMRSGKLLSLGGGKTTPRDVLVSIYLTVLSRPPTDDEIKILYNYSKSSGLVGRDMFLDVVWALMNSKEFLFRH